MGRYALLILLLFECLVCVFAFNHEDEETDCTDLPVENISDLPLILSRYIECNQTNVARNLSLVESLIEKPVIRSYSGFFTVNKLYNSNLFFWFFPALVSPTNAPLILWLSGGPGGSGISSLFSENGPYKASRAGQVSFNQYTWLRNVSMVYVDNPVFAGFSFTDEEEGLAKDQEHVGRDLFEFVTQFFLLFPEFKNSDFYIAGESYGGKFATALAYKIHSNRVTHDLNFKGVILAAGFCDPGNMLNYSDLLYQVGLIDKKAAKVFVKQQTKVKNLLDKGKFWKAFQVMNRLLYNVALTEPSYFQAVTGTRSYHNFVEPVSVENFTSYLTVVLSPRFKNLVHVGNLRFNSGADVFFSLMGDFLKTIRPWIEVILDHYKVLVYTGQLDVIVGYTLTLNYLEALKWKGAESFQNVDRIIWKVKGDDAVAGYVRQVNNFTEALVRGAGHMVAYDKPKEVLDLIERFIFDLPYDA